MTVFFGKQKFIFNLQLSSVQYTHSNISPVFISTPKKGFFEVLKIGKFSLLEPNFFPPSHFFRFENTKQSLGANPENMVDEVLIRSLIHKVFPLKLHTSAPVHYLGRKELFSWPYGAVFFLNPL